MCTYYLSNAHSSLHLRLYMFYFLTHTYLSVKVLCFVGPPLVLLTKTSFKADMRSLGAHFGQVHPDVSQLRILVGTIGIFFLWSSFLLGHYRLIL